jgi:hypothetical protein
LIFPYIYKKHIKRIPIKKIKEQKENLTEGLMDLIWKKLMKGKKSAIINAYDNDPGVASAINDMEKANQKLRATLERIHKKHNLKTKI